MFVASDLSSFAQDSVGSVLHLVEHLTNLAKVPESLDLLIGHVVNVSLIDLLELLGGGEVHGTVVQVLEVILEVAEDALGDSKALVSDVLASLDALLSSRLMDGIKDTVGGLLGTIHSILSNVQPAEVLKLHLIVRRVLLGYGEVVHRHLVQLHQLVVLGRS